MKSMNVRITTGSKKSRLRISRGLASVFLRPAALLIAAGLLLFFSPTQLFAQKTTDFVLLLDNSESMFRQNGNNAELLVSSMMKNKLNYQDRFHLLSFSGRPELEMDRVLRDKESVQDVLGRIMMLQPVQKDTDILSALRFLTDYMSELPLNSEKYVLIFSDDIHQPPVSSTYQNLNENRERIETIADYIKRNGWKIDVVLFPELDTSKSEQTANVQRGLLSLLAEKLGTKVSFFDGDLQSLASAPADDGVSSEDELLSQDVESTEDMSSSGPNKESDTGSAFGSLRLIYLILIFIIVFILLFFIIRRVFGSSGPQRTATGEGSERPLTGLRNRDERDSSTFTKHVSDSTSILSEAKRKQAEGREGPYDSYQKKRNDSSLIRKDQRGQESGATEIKRKKDDSGVSVLAAFAARDRSERDGLSLRIPGRSSDRRGGQRTASGSQFKSREGQNAIEMRVDFQRNTFRKNTRWFDEGASFSIGQQGVADFEISSIDISGVIATIRKKGDIYILNPEQAEYFPDLKNLMAGCLNKNIRVISPDTGFATTILFHIWLSPLDRLNRMLHVIDKAGKPDPDLD